MGAWGYGIFDDDLARDVRGDFEGALDEGLSVSVSTRRVLEEHADTLEDPDDGPVIWLSLAALQMEQGALQPDVKERVLAVVDRGIGLDRWAEAGPEMLAERRRVLEEFGQRVRSGEVGSARGKQSRRSKRAKPQIGDVFVIPLPDGRKAYGQYVHYHMDPYGPWGETVHVFDLITEKEVPVERLATARPMFPPVVVMLPEALSRGRWQVIGRLSVEAFSLPLYRYLQIPNPAPGVYHDWWLWDGREGTFIGDLSPEYRSLEYWQGYDAEELEHRIATGEYFGERLL